MNLQNIIHGRETYVTYYGPHYILKRPLASSEFKRQEWLKKQTKTQEVIDAVASLGNPAYNIPRMHYVNPQELSVLEQRAPGQHLDKNLYDSLSHKQKTQIIYGIANFLIDMNELKPVSDKYTYNITQEVNFNKLSYIISSKLPKLLNKSEIISLENALHQEEKIEYETFSAWSHSDLNTTNVLYDPDTNKLSFIDFADANYKFIYHDIFSPLQMELGINKAVYEQYKMLHNQNLYPIMAPNSHELKQVIKTRLITILLKRFIKASDDIHINTTAEKGKQNNIIKIQTLHNIIKHIQQIQEK